MVESFETYRTYLFAIAYRMLGSAMDAEDMVQETYLRYLRTPKDSIGSLKAFLTTIISRLCVDQLHLARRKREQYYDYAEIASFLGKSEVACRQWFSRAKKHLGHHRPRFQASPETQRQMLKSFQQALEKGEMAPLMNLLAEDVTFWADGGGKVKGVATQRLFGRDVVVPFILSNSPIFRSTLPGDSRLELAEVNGQPALITRSGDRALAVLAIDVEADHIKAIRFVANPDKPAHI